MKNNLDRQYLELVNHILRFGYDKKDRTGTGTKSTFGWQIRHSMKDGFPLLTTKKMAFKTMTVELLWFLRGDTNIKFLVDRNCHIWDGDAWKNYQREVLDRFMNDTTIAGYAITSKEEFIDKIKTDDEFAKKWGDLRKVYGHQWRSWETKYIKPKDRVLIKPSNGWPENSNIDQIANVIHLLKTDPDSRRMIVNAWNVGELHQMVLPPCHMMFQFYTRELSLKERCDAYMKWSNDSRWVEWKNHIENEMGWDYEKPEWVFKEVREQLDKAQFPTRAISLQWTQRSVDVGLGLPFNIASYALLLELVAKSVNMVPEDLIGNLGDCHIYNNHIDGLKEQLERTPYELPKLNINTEWWPTESGECGVGPIDATAVFNSFTNDRFCKCLLEDDIQLYNYQSHPAIKLPLSN